MYVCMYVCVSFIVGMRVWHVKYVCILFASECVNVMYVCMYVCMYVSRSKYMYICMDSLSCGYRIFIEPENHSYPSGEKVGCSMELRHSMVIRINLEVFLIKCMYVCMFASM